MPMLGIISLKLKACPELAEWAWATEPCCRPSFSLLLHAEAWATRFDVAQTLVCNSSVAQTLVCFKKQAEA